MEYISIKQAAEKWSLTERRVQVLCKDGKISGATRFGKSWMIPENADKPVDGRVKLSESEKVKSGLLLPAPRQNPLFVHTNLYTVPGTADEVVASFSAYPETARIIRAQFDYHRGDIDKVYDEIQYFLKVHEGFNSVIGTAVILSRCAIWRGDINLWEQARRHFYKAPCKTEEDRKIVAFWLAVTDSAVHDTEEFPAWFVTGNFRYLPYDTLTTARIFYVKYMYICAYELAKGNLHLKDVEQLGLMRTLPFVIEPMLSQAVAEKTVIPQIHLHMIAATVYHHLGQEEKAIPHIDRAIRLCIPDRLYNVLVEYRTGLDSLLDERLMAVDEKLCKTVRELNKVMYEGWVKLHNQVMQRSVSAILTTREREVARLAAFGMTNAEIAAQLNIEVQSVKYYIFTAMNKVGAEKRAELSWYV